MCVCCLVILRFVLQFQAQHVRSKPWLRWCQGSPWRTTLEPMQCRLQVRLHLAQRRRWKELLLPELSSGGLNGDCKTRRTLRMRLHPMTALWHMQGTTYVADAWLQARSKSIEADLIPQAAAVAESSGSKDRPATWPTPKASMMKKSKMVQALRVRPGPDQPEHVLLRAEALRKAFSQAKVMRPQGELTPERYSQWQDALDTLAKRKVTEAEGATVVNALKSWAELRAYMEQKDRLFPPDALDLYGFLQNGTSGPYRAFHSLKWFSKHGRLQWDFSDVPVPARKNPPKQANPKQAVAVEPPMIAALEERIQSLYEAGDPRWRGLLSSWLVAFGVLRYKHIMRARPVKVTPCSFHGYCPKGKQKANRGGFSFSIPATFINGWAWGSALFRDYSSLGKAKQATSGLCFDAEGTAYTLKFVNELNREVFEHLVQNAEDLSSYSWRRAGPTVGTLMNPDRPIVWIKGFKPVVQTIVLNFFFNEYRSIFFIRPVLFFSFHPPSGLFLFCKIRFKDYICFKHIFCFFLFLILPSSP